MTRQTFIQTKFKILVGQLIVIVKVKKDLIIDFIASFENIIATFGYGVNSFDLSFKSALWAVSLLQA